MPNHVHVLIDVWLALSGKKLVITNPSGCGSGYKSKGEGELVSMAWLI
jgi:hypothetical protein